MAPRGCKGSGWGMIWRALVCVCVCALRKPPVHYNGMRRSCSSYLELLLAKKKKSSWKFQSQFQCILRFSFTHSAYFLFLSAFPSPLLSPSLSLILLTAHTLLHRHLSTQAKFPPPSLWFYLSISPSSCALPFLPLTLLFQERTDCVPVSAAAGQGF